MVVEVGVTEFGVGTSGMESALVVCEGGRSHNLRCGGK